MPRMPFKKTVIYFALFAVLYWAIGQLRPVNAFVHLVRVQSSEQSSLNGIRSDPAFLTLNLDETGKQALYNRIKQKAEETRIAPVNAKIDRVWKAIPGYNGLEIDVDKTYKVALNNGDLNHLHAVYREIPPSVNLEDLPPNPIYKGNSNKPMVSLMINVAWGDAYLPSILSTLKKENVHATFFLDGTWLSKNMDAAREILAQGHEISNHAYTHKNMSTLSAAQAEAEINKTETLLQQLHVENHLFAPPSGDYDMDTVHIAAKQGLKTVLWTIDTVDWKNPSPEWIVAKISRNLEPGSMILMHPTSASSRALPQLIRTIKSKDLTIGTVSQLISPKRVPNIEPPLDF